MIPTGRNFSIKGGQSLSQRRSTQQNSPVSVLAGWWKHVLLIVALINCLEIAIFTSFNLSMKYVQSGRDDNHKYDLHPDDVGSYREVGPPQTNGNITFVGISFSDTTISDMAAMFLVQAACEYGIQSHILLAERDAEHSFTKKIAALAHHWQPLPTDGKDAHPFCLQLIHVSLAPSEDYLLNMTKTHVDGTSFDDVIINNPLDSNNRIAKIKRSREYQRQKIRSVLRDTHGTTSSSLLWQENSVIGVLDLDLLRYPSIPTVIQSAIQYILPSFGTQIDESNDKKYHALCSHGIMVQMSRSKRNYTTRYYDTFSTILLPNSWLHRDRISPRGALKGEDVQLASMDQVQIFHYILEQGRISTDGGVEVNEVTTSFEPVPVQSCFNGLTMYRADVWLEPECSYDGYNENDAAFASEHYRHTCEHVVLHECLRRKWSGSKEGGFAIAVRPDMTTLWHLVEQDRKY